MSNLYDFVNESNLIENIRRPPTEAELNELARFVRVEKLTVDELIRFVHIYQPDARLRNKAGLDVQVGKYVPPKGGPEIRPALEKILRAAAKKGSDAWDVHMRYEHLHPFTDCNGRSGRALWAWQMGPTAFHLTFLHRFYYQSIEHWRGETK